MADARKVLVISTYHLSEATLAWLDSDDLRTKPGLPWGGRTPDGYFLYAHDDDASMPSAPHADDGRYPKDLWACFAEARRKGCAYVLFDEAAEKDEDIPVQLN